MVTEILEKQSELRDAKGIFMTELSPTLLQTLIALRSVYQVNLRKEVFHSLIPEVIEALNKGLKKHRLKIKVQEKQKRKRYSSSTLVRLVKKRKASKK